MIETASENPLPYPQRSAQPPRDDAFLTQERFSQILNAAGLGTYAWDLTTGYVNWSQLTCRLFNCRPEDFTHDFDSFISRVHADDRKRVLEALQISLDNHSDFNCEFRTVDPRGRVRWLFSSGSCTYNEVGEAVSFSGSVRDITEQKRNSDFLSERAAYFRHLVDHSPVILWIAEADMKCSYLSQRWYEYTGRTPIQDLDHGWFENLHIDDVERTKEIFLSANVNKSPFSIDFRLRHKDGSYRWVVSLGQPLLDSTGKFSGFIGTVMDVNQRKETELALKQAKEQAESASQLKNSFLANMSHEIRTPMTAVLGFAEILHDPTLSEADRFDSIRRIEQSGRNLLRLIDDILDISKIEAGRLRIEKVVFSPLEVINEVIAMLQLQASAKKLDLCVEIKNALPAAVVSDPTRLRQILINLLGNAIKFTQKGEVILRVFSKHISESECHLVFEVRDSGIGIPIDKQCRLFQPFAQADESITRKFGGTGLGLILSKRLAEHLGGNLELMFSQPGHGSCFQFQIACGVSSDDGCMDVSTADSLGDEAPERSLEGVRVLIAEDIAENQLLFKIYLEGAGAVVDMAVNGEQALHMIERENYDIILMDVQMPVLDGLQATRTLRERGYSKPILALTAHAMSNEKELSQNSGCNDHLTKPISRYKLVESIKKHLI